MNETLDPHLVECLGNVQEHSWTEFPVFKGISNYCRYTLNLFDCHMIRTKAKLVGWDEFVFFGQSPQMFEKKFLEDLADCG